MVCVTGKGCIMKGRDGDIERKGSIKVATCPNCKRVYTITPIGITIKEPKEE